MRIATFLIVLTLILTGCGLLQTAAPTVAIVPSETSAPTLLSTFTSTKKPSSTPTTSPTFTATPSANFTPSPSSTITHTPSPTVEGVPALPQGAYTAEEVGAECYDGRCYMVSGETGAANISTKEVYCRLVSGGPQNMWHFVILPRSGYAGMWGIEDNYFPFQRDAPNHWSSEKYAGFREFLTFTSVGIDVEIRLSIYGKSVTCFYSYTRVSN